MYYQGGNSGIQPDGLQTLYLMNPNYVGYSDTTQHQPAGLNMVFFNSTASTNEHEPNTAAQMLHALPPPPVASLHERQPSHGGIPRFHYNMWSSNEQPGNDNRSHMASPVAAATSGDRGGVMVSTQKGLSLSLSSQQTGFRSVATYHDVSQVGLMTNKLGLSTSVSNGINDVQNGIMGSKYTKAVQHLLDEVVNVGKILKTSNLEGSKEKGKKVKQSTTVNLVEGSGGGGESSAGGELTTAQRQETRMKKAKLVTMLDEVEQRYRQYHHQMQIIVASFEQAAGPGSAKSYTHLAMKTISKQFRCLKEAISGQIKAINKSLDEEESLVERLGGSRLKYIDNQLRQQQALQQLGMVQTNPWRPQRGLPERAVSVLRAWLFEHFLHPYPKDSDKQMLAKQTGLTRSQVSNWFINARVRLWKPMVEEMYLEEVKNNEQNSSEENPPGEKTTPDKEFSSSKSQENNNLSQIDYINNSLQYSKPDKPTNQVDYSPRDASTSTLTTSPNAGSLYQPRASFVQLMKNTHKKPRIDTRNSPSSILSMEVEKSTGQKENYFTMMDTNHGTEFGKFDIGQLGRLNAEPLGFHGNNVSLTLGLPPSENSGSQGSQEILFSNPNNELGTRIGEGTKESEYNLRVTQSSIGYGIVDFQNRKPFASQLLPDFVV